MSGQEETLITIVTRPQYVISGRVRATLASSDGEVFTKDVILDMARQMGWEHEGNVIPVGDLRLEATFEILESHTEEDGITVIDDARLIEVSVVGVNK